MSWVHWAPSIHFHSQSSQQFKSWDFDQLIFRPKVFMWCVFMNLRPWFWVNQNKDKQLPSLQYIGLNHANKVFSDKIISLDERMNEWKKLFWKTPFKILQYLYCFEGAVIPQFHPIVWKWPNDETFIRINCTRRLQRVKSCGCNIMIVPLLVQIFSCCQSTSLCIAIYFAYFLHVLPMQTRFS